MNIPFLLPAALAGLLAPSMASAQSDVAPPVRPPMISYTTRMAPPPNPCGPLTWPMEALRYELEGRATVMVDLDAQGRATDVTLVQSSGWKLIDDATVAYARACRYSPQQVAYWRTGKMPMQLVWKLESDDVVSDPVLVPDSCARSPAFVRFAPRNEAGPADLGVKVRFLVDKQGQPHGVKSEGPALPAQTAAALTGYVESCRFTYDPAAPGLHGDTMYGRVVLR
jgi:TonB family protein